jgi:hypothetical protein
MGTLPTYEETEEHQRVYDLIWSQMPRMQKRTSSSWWFFILFPEGEQGYGPRQIMFTIASRVGKRIRVNDMWFPGIDLNRSIVDGEDKFHAISVGWYCDGHQVHEDILKETAVTTLSASNRVIKCWAREENSEGHGFEIRQSAGRPLALQAQIKGENGNARFEAWGDLDSLHSSPAEAINIDTIAGGTHFIAWRRMNFEGEFDLAGTGSETLTGICYFQRVCLNVPTFPWKWLWALFPDGTMFSAYVPYLGFNLFRKGYKFLNRNWKEQASISVSPGAFWDRPGPSEQIRFGKAAVTPILGRGPHPRFQVKVSNKQGDYLEFLASPYGHTRFYIDRPVLRGLLETHWDYNEYMFRMEHLAGRVGGEPISRETMGQGFGTLEYTWGLGL